MIASTPKCIVNLPTQTPMLFGEGNRLVFGSDYASLQYAVTVMQVDAAKNPVRLLLNAGQAQGLSEGAQLAIYPPGTTDFTQEEKQLAIAEIVEIGATDAWADIVKTIRTGEIEPAAQAVLLSAPVEVVRTSPPSFINQKVNCLQVLNRMQPCKQLRQLWLEMGG